MSATVRQRSCIAAADAWLRHPGPVTLRFRDFERHDAAMARLYERFATVDLTQEWRQIHRFLLDLIVPAGALVLV